MAASDIVDLVRYDAHLWRRFADFFAESCSWDELSRDHGASHNTIANVSMHAINMQDWWLHFVRVGKAWDGPAWDGFKDAGSMRERVRAVTERTEKFVAGLDEKALAQRLTLEVGDDKTETTLGRLLLEVVNESTHHRGEVMAMLWRMDREPPYESFLEFVEG